MSNPTLSSLDGARPVESGIGTRLKVKLKSPILKAIIACLVGASICGLLVWAFVEGRQELQKERERELPVKVPPRVTKDSEGRSVIKLDQDTQALVKLKIESVVLPSERKTSRGVQRMIVPNSAIVRSEGKTWVYVTTSPETFVRKELISVEDANSGSSVEGLSSKDQVVTEGAQLLLSEEMKSVIQIGEEGK